MGISKFEVGQPVVFNGEHCTVLHKLPNGIWQLAHRDTGELRNLTLHELNKAVEAGKIFFVNKTPAYPPRDNSGMKFHSFQRFEELPKKLQDEAKNRLRYVRDVILRGSDAHNLEFFEEVAENGWNNTPRELRDMRPRPKWLRKPSGSSVYRWHKRYMEGGQDILALVPWVHLRGSTKRRINPKIIEIVDAAINKIYMKRERGTKEDTRAWALSEVFRHNRTNPYDDPLPLPSKSLVSRMINAIPYVDRLIARFGREYARRKLRHCKGHYVAQFPLEYVELDHTVFDCMVIDDDTHLPLGRPYIAVSIDMYSRCVHGIYISFTPPSIMTVFRCLRHGFLPKASLRDEYPEIHNSWDCHGVMHNLVLDNGMENHSKDLWDLADRFNFKIKFCPRKQPWFKPFVERFIGTLNRAVAHKLPGTTFANIFEKDDYDPAKTAVVPLSGLRKAIYKWIVDEYHQSKHRTLHDTPANVWLAHPGTDNPFLPDDPFELKLMFCRSEERVLTHKGIEIFGLFYNSDELLELRKQYGEKLDVIVRYDDSDIGEIYVEFSDSPEMICVPAPDQAYAKGLSLWQHKHIRRYARKFLDGREDLEALVEAKRELAEIFEKEFRLPRKRRKGRGGIVARYREDMAKNASAEATPEPMDPGLSDVQTTTDAPKPQSAADREREILRARRQASQAAAS